jgi:hypothetical protein
MKYSRKGIPKRIYATITPTWGISKTIYLLLLLGVYNPTIKCGNK